MVLGHDILTCQRTQDIKITEQHTFDSMLLSQNTLKGLQGAGFYVPSPIQLHGIPWGKCGCDLLLEAKSGTGKTAVFSVIALEQLNLNKGVQTLILAPTREIASQICDVIRTIGICYEGLSVAVVMGGLPYEEDVEKFRKKVHIVVGSPGRLRALIQQKHIDVSSVRLMVLDEADKLVDKSFLVDINYIFSLLPHQKQVILSSATYPGKVRTDIKKYVQSPLHICPDSNSILLGIEQQVTIVPNHINIVNQIKNRYDELIKILSRKQFKQCIVFCNYTSRVDEIHRKLNKDKWPSDKLCGQQDQTDRLEALRTLQAYNCRILVTTDLTARGIDSANVDLVINFELPYDWQTYLHRIGRAGRFGSYGTAITVLCEGTEVNKFKNILRSMNMLCNLKHLWSNEPFEMNESRKVVNCQFDEPKSQTKESEEQLDIQETYDELWKVLSTDLTEEKLPSFKSLCDSFEETNQNSNEEIENFQELLSSFQNSEIKSIYDSEYKTIKVNKLIMPCNGLNHSIIQNDKSPCEALKLVEEEIKSVVSCEPSSFKLENKGIHENSINGTTNHVYVSENDKRKADRGDRNEDQSSSSTEFEVDYCERELCKPESKANVTNGCQSTEYDDDEKALFAANLPVAFGKYMNANKTKSMKEHSYNHDKIEKLDVHRPNVKKSVFPKPNQKHYHVHELSESDESAFGKSMNANKTKSLKEHYSYNQDKIEKLNVHRPNVKKPVFSKPTQKNYVHELTESDESENESDSTEQSFRSKEFTFHKPNSDNFFRSNAGNYNNHTQNNIERQQEFDIWYQNLRAYTLTIEQSVYIAEMSKPY